MKLTIIPDIIFRGTTIDYGDFDGGGNRGRRATRTFRLIPSNPITIEINVNPRQSVAQIRSKYIKKVRETLM